MPCVVTLNILKYSNQIKCEKKDDVKCSLTEFGQVRWENVWISGMADSYTAILSQICSPSLPEVTQLKKNCIDFKLFIVCLFIL